MYDKEKIYDEKIAPLMTEIIKICKENDIQMFASYFLRRDEEGEFNCTTYIPSKEGKNKTLEDMYKVMYKGWVIEKPFVAAMTIRRG